MRNEHVCQFDEWTNAHPFPQLASQTTASL